MTTPVLVRWDSLWWPALDTDARGVITADCKPSIAALLPHVKGRDVIVQAGACVGVYPLELAKHFANVFTTEPDPANYECLARNIAEQHKAEGVITFPPRPAAFGAEPGSCSPVVVTSTNCGAHRVEYGEGAIPVMTIDSLSLPACDCVWADVEGSELFLLQGAADTIERYSPTIAVEDKGLHRSFGIPDGALQAWLAERGYSEVARIGRDKIFTRRH
jgi:FkbM family methyltransferase